MNRFYLLVLLSLLLFSCSPQEEKKDGYIISGIIKGVDEGNAYLQETSPDGLITIDSAAISNGEYVFSGNTNLPEVYYIKINNSNKYITFFLENSKITIDSHVDSLFNSKIEGSICQLELDEFYDKLFPYKQKLKNLYKSYYKAERANDGLRMKEIDEEYERVHDQQIDYIKSFAHSNPGSVVASYVAARYLANELNYPALDSLYNSLKKDLENTKYIVKLKDRLDILENVAVGKPVVEIAPNDTSNHPVSLASLKGKYVLIEFWASWCLSCKEENKKLRPIYAEYSKKGFEIFGISLDNDRTNWIKAINEDSLPWINVSDLKGWQSDTRKLYGVTTTPHNILVDKEGIIIAKDVYGEILEKELIKLNL